MKKHSFYRLALPATVFALAMGGATGCNSASAAEQEENPRSRSAKLRIAEKIAD